MAKETKQAKKLKGDDLLNAVEQAQMKKEIPEFHVGDTVDVAVRIKEGDRERIQIYSGICIARTGGGIRENFTVRRIVQGEGVERIFPLHSPFVEGVTIKRRGKPRRAKLHYLRDRVGKAVRVKEIFPSKAKAAAEKQ